MKRGGRAGPPFLGALALGVTSLAVVAELRPADAQKLDPRRPAEFVVGGPGGASPTMRIDGRRTGASKELLPSGVLRVAWRKSIASNVDQPALAGADGTLAVVTARGDVVFLDAAGGEERGRVTTGAALVGPATLTSDGTVVFTSSAGDAIGVRSSSPRPRFVAHVGGERNARAAPLSLDDGGVVVVASSDLVVLDAEGGVRARTSLPEPPAAPLLAAGNDVIAVTTTGAVYGWTPGREPVRRGSFGAPIDGGAALLDATTLIAALEGNHLVELDLARGGRTTRSVAPQGLYLGPPSVRAAAEHGGLATLLAYAPTRAFVVTIDAAGHETERAPIAVFAAETLADGGPKPLVAPPHTGPIVDPRGAVAFAAPDGRVGVVGPDGSVETLAELICSRGARAAGVVGLTPTGRGTFAVTCESGILAKIAGGAGANASESESVLRPGSALTGPSRSSAEPAPRSLPDDDDP